MLHITSSPQRLRWLYISNIIGAGVPGLIMVSFPQWAANNMFPGEHDPAMFGITGSIWLAIGIASALGLRTSQLFKSLFVMQIIYKMTWILTVALPLLLRGNVDVLPVAIFFALVVAGFSYGLFGEKSEKTLRVVA
ncbi:MAG: hypothetical protein AAGF95_32485 [Chloroflexota bacterium]